MRTLRVFLILFAAFILRAQQTADQPLTNAEIESMLSSGLPESTIVLKIQKAAHFGLVNLDSSAAALISLKEKGAREQVLNAVVFAEPFGAEWKEAQAEERQAEELKKAEEQALPDLPDEAGVYVKGSSGWARLPVFLFWAPLYSGSAWMHNKHAYSVPIADQYSEVPAADTMPGFYVRSPQSGTAWQVIRVSAHNSQREVRLVSGRGFDETGKIAPTDIREVQMTHVAGAIFNLRPKAQLDVGEYALCSNVIGGPGLKQCYGFTVRR